MSILKQSLRTICLLLIIHIIGTQVYAVYGQGNPTPSAPVTDNDVNRVARGLYCPVCQNVPLEVCETQACIQWRDEIRDLLQQGYTDEQIRQRFIDQYGTRTVGMPVNNTAIFLTIVLPFALIGLIGIVIGVNFWKWRRGAIRAANSVVDQTPMATPPIDDYHQRLEEEIRKRD